MAKLFINPFKNPKLKAFFFFLILATVFWVLTKFSKQDTATFQSFILYTNAPQGTVFSDNNPKKISYTVSANKFELLYLYFKRPIINVDVSEIADIKSRKVFISETELSPLIQKQIKSGGTVNKTSPQELEIILDAVNFKKIAIQLSSDIKYKDGFQQVGRPKLEPDSLIVTGAKKYIDTLQIIKTQILSLNNIEDDITTTLAFQKIDTAKIKIESKNVVVSIDVEEFSQKEISIPIEVINQPMEGTIKLLPKTIKLTFTVPVSLFNTISVKDFKIICDYDKRNKEDNFMTPELIEIPNEILNIEMETKKIDILLFK
ncbi:hypothetical protein [Patiriisocius sp. Uisw_017]|jgi:hypothetical protein|uniref:hypothetical protein n=1 Tax=Patiriisocius sp. Uisw_017 TaxID=3230968 RepID=UPI0039E7DC51